jgi:hypothetical protein
MKRSKQVPLILLGALTSLTGCSRSDVPATAQQGCYTTMQDCGDDWGDTALCKLAPGAPAGSVAPDAAAAAAAAGPNAAGPCRPAPAGATSTGSTSTSHGGAMFIGPRYYWDRGAGRPMVVEDGRVSLAKSGAASRGPPVHAISTHTVAVARGGFGAHGGGHGSGGG